MFESAETLWVVHMVAGDRVALRAKEDFLVAIDWPDMGDEEILEKLLALNLQRARG